MITCSVAKGFVLKVIGTRRWNATTGHKRTNSLLLCLIVQPFLGEFLINALIDICFSFEKWE
jgi:hypothetical protein